MDKDDPFGLSDDVGRTRIRPVKQPRRQQAPQPQRREQPNYGHEPASAQQVRHGRAHPNSLISAFSQLLEFAPEMEAATAPDDPETLRTRLQHGLTDARDQAVASGSNMQRADGAAWAVAALLDDLALNTPWGGNGAWPHQPLVSMLYGDVDAGTQFFERLEELERHSSRDPEMLELYYMCMALGFRGKYRVSSRAGDQSLTAVRSSVARFLRNPDAEDAPLSPNWRGVIAADEPSRFIVPPWVLGVVAIGSMTLIYMLLSLQLSSQSETLNAVARALPPEDRAEIYRVQRIEQPIQEVIPAPVLFELVPEFEEAAPENLRAAISGEENVARALMQIQNINPELFRSGRADLNDGFDPLITSVAQVLTEYAEVIGKITVIGHTDSQKVGRSNPFSNNQRLSEARAAKIADLLIAAGIDPDRIGYEGHAADEPIADNGTVEGRAKNRRVEILVQKRL